MSTQSTKQAITKQIVFPSHLAKNAEMRAEELGISFPDYVRYLIINDTDLASQRTLRLSKEVTGDILKARGNYASGEYSTLSTDDEIDRFVSNARDESK